MLIGCVRCAEEEKEIGRKSVSEKRQRIKELVEWEIKAESKRYVLEWHCMLEGGNPIFKDCQRFCRKSVSR